MDTDIKNFIINSLSGLLTAIVVIYLDRNGFTSLGYVVFGLYLLFLIAVAIKIHKSQKSTQAINQPSQGQTDNKENKDIKQSHEEIFNKQILLHVIKLRGLNQVASPKNIAAEMKQDAGIILAHLWKLHNEQFVTFITGGKMPTQETDFFLSPKAFEIIEINGDTEQKHPADPE